MSDQRYCVEKAQPHGYHIIDSTGKEAPYLINNMRGRGDITPDLVEYMEPGNLRVASDWCETWNLVEAGHCGACKKKFAEDEKRYPAVGFHSLDRTVCFYCACSQED